MKRNLEKLEIDELYELKRKLYQEHDLDIPTKLKLIDRVEKQIKIKNKEIFDSLIGDK